MYFVYLHTLPNGMIYVGQTKNLFDRWHKCGKGYEKNKDFYEAIKKFGWDNIKHELLYSTESELEAEKFEALFIVFLNSEDPTVGYNQTNFKEKIEKAFAEKRTVNNPKEMENERVKPFEQSIFEGRNIPKSACESIIDAWIFNDKHKQIYKLKQINGLTYTQISKEQKISVRQAKNIVYHYNKIIEDHL